MSGVEKSAMEKFMVEKSGLWKFGVEAMGWKVHQGCNIQKPFVPWVTILVTTEFGKYHLPSWLPSGDGKPTVLLSVMPVILVCHKNMWHVCKLVAHLFFFFEWQNCISIGPKLSPDFFIDVSFHVSFYIKFGYMGCCDFSSNNPQNTCLVTWLLTWNVTFWVKYSIKRLGGCQISQPKFLLEATIF